MSIKITKSESIPKIKITKVENKEQIIYDNDSILTPLYGKIKIGKSVDPKNYTYFDSIDKYDLFISNDGNDTVAVKSGNNTDTKLENEHAESINLIVNDIQNKYNLDINSVTWSDGENAIMINSKNTEILNNIYNDYINNKDFEPEFITNDILFLNKTGEIQLEDDDLLNKLDDNSIKDLAKKTGASLSGSESKDELKGIIKGALSSSNK